MRYELRRAAQSIEGVLLRISPSREICRRWRRRLTPPACCCRCRHCSAGRLLLRPHPHRPIIKTTARLRPHNPSQIKMSGAQEVEQFLEELGLASCVQAVVHQGFYTSMEALHGATYEELVDSGVRPVHAEAHIEPPRQQGPARPARHRKRHERHLGRGRPLPALGRSRELRGAAV